MRITIAKEADALYFRLGEARIVESEEVQSGGILDYDENDQVVGVEFLGTSSRVPQVELSSLHFQTV